MTRLHKASLILALLPLALGLVSFFLWIITAFSVCAAIGLFTIPVGLLCVSASTILMMLHLFLARRRHHMATGRMLLQAGFITCIYMANFIAAAGCIVAASILMQVVCVNVINESDRPLTSIAITQANSALTLPDIPPTGSAKRYFRSMSDGELTLAATHGSNPIHEELGYVATSSLIQTGRYDVRIDNEGQCHTAYSPLYGN